MKDVAIAFLIGILIGEIAGMALCYFWTDQYIEKMLKKVLREKK